MGNSRKTAKRNIERFEYENCGYDIKIPDSFKHSYVFNDDLDNFDKTILDLDYYIRFCKSKMYEVKEN